MRLKRGEEEMDVGRGMEQRKSEGRKKKKKAKDGIREEEGKKEIGKRRKYRVVSYPEQKHVLKVEAGEEALDLDF
ncbi:hypothetical protein C1H46_004324 [Malus baccata]|uniref:Uncharacterized protein n=1 Tax=Malus baccata TaxID=106549 RepID=A0A540NG66_MALBA|nr:hypothetical protein C1H46_004324 [Malus baccata]